MENTNEKNKPEKGSFLASAIEKLDIKSEIFAIVLVIVVAVGLFTDRGYKIRTTSGISRTVTAESISELEKYPALRELDLSGSTCYDEILDYEAHHPEVSVLYTVSVDGTDIFNTQTELNWEGRDVSALLSVDRTYLPALGSIDLGAVGVSDIDAVRAHFPDAELRYCVNIAGETVSCDDSSIDLSGSELSDVSEIAALMQYLPAVKEIKLGDIPFEDYKFLFEACPGVSFDYSFELFGQTVTTRTDTLKYKKVPIGDDGIEYFRTVLPYLPELRYLSFDRCDTTDEIVNQLRDDFPDVKIAWRIFFKGFSCMTDVEKIWAIGSLYTSDCDVLKYCRDVKYLDLGHNNIKYIDFVKDMDKLEVLILSMGTLRDLSPLEGHTALEYLEVTCSFFSDLSPLASCTGLKHLEISLDHNITDITPLYGLDLERFYSLYNNNVPSSQYEEFAALHPDCEIDHGLGKYLMCPLVESRWRYSGGRITERYALLREQIGYDDPHGQTRLYSGED